MDALGGGLTVADEETRRVEAETVEVEAEAE